MVRGWACGHLCWRHLDGAYDPRCASGPRTARSDGHRCRRNAYGRQIDSFEADLDFRGLSDGAFRGVFIRAPWIERTGEGVDVLAEHEGRVVAARQRTLLVTTFHPELTGDPRVHRFFLDEVVGA